MISAECKLTKQQPLMPGNLVEANGMLLCVSVYLTYRLEISPVFTLEMTANSPEQSNEWFASDEIIRLFLAYGILKCDKLLATCQSIDMRTSSD